jgi:hypothetical protein
MEFRRAQVLLPRTFVTPQLTGTRGFEPTGTDTELSSLDRRDTVFPFDAGSPRHQQLNFVVSMFSQWRLC